MKRWWGIRHLRHGFLAWRLDRYMDMCRKVGLGITPSKRDVDYLNDIWNGKA